MAVGISWGKAVSPTDNGRTRPWVPASPNPVKASRPEDRGRASHAGGLRGTHWAPADLHGPGGTNPAVSSSDVRRPLRPSRTMVWGTSASGRRPEGHTHATSAFRSWEERSAAVSRAGNPWPIGVCHSVTVRTSLPDQRVGLHAGGVRPVPEAPRRSPAGRYHDPSSWRCPPEVLGLQASIAFEGRAQVRPAASPVWMI
jgi:hypothetical protein